MMKYLTQILNTNFYSNICLQQRRKFLLESIRVCVCVFYQIIFLHYKWLIWKILYIILVRNVFHTHGNSLCVRDVERDHPCVPISIPYQRILLLSLSQLLATIIITSIYLAYQRSHSCTSHCLLSRSPVGRSCILLNHLHPLGVCHLFTFTHVAKITRDLSFSSVSLASLQSSWFHLRTLVACSVWHARRNFEYLSVNIFLRRKSVLWL